MGTAVAKRTATAVRLKPIADVVRQIGCTSTTPTTPKPAVSNTG